MAIKTIKILMDCEMCKKEFEVEVPGEAYIKMLTTGEFIQNVMPDVSFEIRESVLSQICEECQLELYTY